MGLVTAYTRNLAAIVLGRQPCRPLLFSYYVTQRCGLGCAYCCDCDGKRAQANPAPELNTAEAKRLITILRAAADTLDITGGEPLLREDLEEILAHARQRGFQVVLNTKAIGLRERSGLLRHVNALIIGVDTLDPEKLAAVIQRPVAAARAVLAGLECAAAASQETGLPVFLSAVATPRNLDEVTAVLHYALEHKLGFHLSPEIAGFRAHPDLQSNSAYRKLLDEVMALKQRVRGILGVPEYLRAMRDFASFRCYPLVMPTIRPDGRLYYPCMERNRARVSILEAGDYYAALRLARAQDGELPRCGDECQMSCQMGLSFLQRHPLSALTEGKHWERS